MKLLHLSDLHLGRELLGFNLNEDQKYILARIIELIDHDGIDAVLIAGDVYDKSQPSEGAVNLLNGFLNELCRRGIKVFIISGNHDSDDRLNFGSEVFRNSGIYISSVFDGTLPMQTLNDEYGELDIYMLPFIKASYVRHYFPNAKIETYDDAVRTVIGTVKPDPSRRSVILAHQFVVSDGCNPITAGSEGSEVRSASVGTVESIGFHCFDAFDYAALGHIHSPQAIGRDTVRYSGSPLKYSLSEALNEKTVPVITMAGKGSVSIELVPLKPMRELRHIQGPFMELANPANAENTDDFIYATLTDEETIDDAMNSIQKVYPNTLHIDYDNSRTRNAENVDLSSLSEVQQFPDLIKDFYQHIYKCEIPDEELSYILELAKEAEIYHEAD